MTRRSLVRARPSRLAAAVVVVLVSTLAGGVVSSPAVSAPTDTIVVRWNEVLLDSIRNSTLGPPMVARALAIVHTCMYDAWAAYDPVAAGTRHGDQLRRPQDERTQANKAEAISYAAHHAMIDLFPNRKAQLDAFLASLGYDPHHHPMDTVTPAGIGSVACSSVLDFRHGDMSNQTAMLGGAPYSDWTSYRPANQPMVVAQPLDPGTVADPNRWQPLTYPNKAGAIVTPGWLAPHWYRVKPFAMLYGEEHRSPTGPAQYGTPEFAQQAAEVLAISANLTERQKVIAEYWADGPNSEQPPGHWNLFAQFVSRRDHHTVDEDAKLFFALNNAVMDAGIAAWDGKRAYDSVRPITAIRYLYRGQQVAAWGGPGQGTRMIDGGSWVPYQPSWFPTPPFAEYPSGHSTFSAAAAAVLRMFTGSDHFGYSTVYPRGASFVEPGITPSRDVRMSWQTFSEAADEAGLSRRYGGIHFAQGDLDARAMGKTIGNQVWLKASLCFSGYCPE